MGPEEEREVIRLSAGMPRRKMIVGGRGGSESAAEAPGRGEY